MLKLISNLNLGDSNMKTGLKVLFIIAGIWFIVVAGMAYLITSGYYQIDLNELGIPIEQLTLTMWGAAILGVILFAVGLFSKNKDKEGQIGGGKYVNKFPFIVLFLLIPFIIAAILYFVVGHALAFSYYDLLFDFVGENWLIFVIIIGGIALLSAIDMMIFTKLDEFSNPTYIFLKRGKISLGNAFFQVFAAAYTSAPLLYGNKDMKATSARSFVTKLSLFVKLITSFIVFSWAALYVICSILDPNILRLLSS